MTFEAEICGRRAVAIAMISIRSLVGLRLRQQHLNPKQPNFFQHQSLVGLQRRQTVGVACASSRSPFAPRCKSASTRIALVSGTQSGHR